MNDTDNEETTAAIPFETMQALVFGTDKQADESEAA